MARLFAALLVFVSFTAYSVMVLLADGPEGILTVALGGGWSTQITLDLACSATIACLWLVPDAKRHGLTPWPFVAVVPLLGSIGLLAYLVAREWTLVRASTPIPT